MLTFVGRLYIIGSLGYDVTLIPTYLTWLLAISSHFAAVTVLGLIKTHCVHVQPCPQVIMFGETHKEFWSYSSVYVHLFSYLSWEFQSACKSRIQCALQLHRLYSVWFVTFCVQSRKWHVCTQKLLWTWGLPQTVPFS